MFDCTQCTARAIRAFGKEVARARPGHRFQSPQLLLTPQLGNRLYTESAIATAASVALRNGEEALIQSVGKTQSDPIKVQYETAIRKELQWLQDPLKLANHVHYTLRCNQSAKALDLVRRASRTMNCVVSWNHIVDWLMKQEKSEEAIKVYNEMKKRAQFPDSYTYILLLRGLIFKTPLLEKHQERKRATDCVNKAVHIYNSMNTATSRVKPSIMHTNALLRVCSFASDLDAFWGVAGQIPEAGPGAADHITYTTIFDAIRHGAISGLPEDYSETEMFKCRLDALDQALRIWPEVIAKWRSGRIKIDDELVASMGRVLMLSPRMEEWDSVLDLVQQTMNIERLAPKLGSPDRQTGHVPRLADQPPTELSSETADSVSNSDSPTPVSRSFESVQPVVSKSLPKVNLPSLLYAKAGNSTLSILIEACDKMRLPKALNLYWERFTKECGVVPDVSNYDALLDNLYLNRGSLRAASIIREMVSSNVIPNKQTLIRAMKVCRRDTKNRHMFDAATGIVKVMNDSLADSDPGLCMHYLGLALATGDGTKIVLALNTLDISKNNLVSYMNYGSASGRRVAVAADFYHKEVTVRLFEMMVGTIDTLMNQALVPREDFHHYHVRRKMLTSFITRARDNLKHAQAKLPPNLVERIHSQVRGVGKPRSADRMIVQGERQFPPKWARAEQETTPEETDGVRGDNAASLEHTDDHRSRSEHHKTSSRRPAFRPRSDQSDRGARNELVGRNTERSRRRSPLLPRRQQEDAPQGFADSPADLGM